MSSKLDPGQILKGAYNDSLGSLKVQGVAGALVTDAYDYLSFTYGATSDVVVYKTGGASGATVATVTIQYVDSTKADISSVTKV